jgi:hypothetical protein
VKISRLTMRHKPGDSCERVLDGLGFRCKVLEVNADGSLKLEFEDGFVENEVPPEEVQDVSGGAAAPAEVQEAGAAQVVTEPLSEPKVGACAFARPFSNRVRWVWFSSCWVPVGEHQNFRHRSASCGVLAA